VVKGEEQPPEEDEDDATHVLGADEQAAAMGYAGASPRADEWTVTLDDGSQKEAAIDALRKMYQEGQIHPDSYVWREGMSDWQPLRDTPELFSALKSSASRSPRPRPSSALATADARLGGGLFGGGSAQQARVEHRDRDQDLFGAAQHPVEEEVSTSAPVNPMEKPAVPKFTAERGENSVLFTIDTIMAVGTQSAKRPSAFPEEEKIDFRKLASVVPPPMDSGDFGASFESPPSFGGPALGALAAPTLPTSIEPEPMPEPVAEPEAMYPYDAPAKSNKGLIIGLGAAVVVLLLVTLGLGGYFLFGSSEEPVAANTTTPTAEAVTAPEDKTDDKSERTTDNEKKDDGAQDAKDKKEDGADKDKKDDKKDEATAKADATGKVGGPLPVGTGTAKAVADPVKSDPKADSKKDDAKPADVPAASADRKFSRSAAVSALNAAAGAASGCKKPDGPTGRGRVSVTFAPSGRVTTAVVNGPPFAGTSVGGCVAAAFRRATVPPFDGSPVTVHKSFSIN
jgi:hypothetical protein